MGAEPIITESTRKHDIVDDDILHAFNYPVTATELDEGFTMLVGPSRDAQLLEVGVVVGTSGPVIVHAMPARPKFLPGK